MGFCLFLVSGDVAEGIVFKAFDDFALFVGQGSNAALVVAMVIVAPPGLAFFQVVAVSFAQFVPGGLLGFGQWFGCMPIGSDRERGINRLVVDDGRQQLVVAVQDGDQVVALVQVAPGCGLVILGVAFFYPPVERVVFKLELFGIAFGIRVVDLGELVEQVPGIGGFGTGFLMLFFDQVATPVMAVFVLFVALQAALCVVALAIVNRVARCIMVVGPFAGL